MTIENNTTYNEFKKLEVSILNAIDTLLTLSDYYGVKEAKKALKQVKKLKENLFNARLEYDKKRLKNL